MNKFETMAFYTWAKAKNLTAEEILVLAEIIEATGNETVAIELLLGVYDHVHISKTPMKKLNYDNRALPVFLSFDKFTGTITYGYNKVEKKSVWVLKTGLHPTFADIKPEMEVYSTTVQARERGITVAEFEDLYERVTIQGPIDESIQLEATCDLKDWQ